MTGCSKTGTLSKTALWEVPTGEKMAYKITMLCMYVCYMYEGYSHYDIWCDMIYYDIPIHLMLILKMVHEMYREVATPAAHDS
jgi:hypothetical protein